MTPEAPIQSACLIVNVAFTDATSSQKARALALRVALAILGQDAIARIREVAERERRTQERTRLVTVMPRDTRSKWERSDFGRIPL